MTWVAVLVGLCLVYGAAFLLLGGPALLAAVSVGALVKFARRAADGEALCAGGEFDGTVTIPEGRGRWQVWGWL